MSYPKKGEQRNTGRTHFKKGFSPWNKGKKGLQKSWNKGLKASDDIRVKRFTEAGHNANRGKKYSIEHKRKLSDAHKKGKDSHLWTGGSVYWAKRQAKIRDNYTCQVCGLRDVEIMEVDHVNPQVLFPELKASIENLMTLCPNCHRRKTLRDRKNLPFKVLKHYKKTITAD